MTTSLYYAVGMIAIFTVGGITGIFLAVFPVDWQLNDTYFVVAHFHYTIFGGAIFPVLAGIYYWFPKMTGRLLNERLGKISFWFTFIGFNATFLVQHAPPVRHAAADLYLPTRSRLVDVQPDLDDRRVHPRRRHPDDDRQRRDELQDRAAGGAGSVEGQHARVVRPVAAAGEQLDEIPRVRSVEPMRDVRRQIERTTGVRQKTGGNERFAGA